MKIAFFDTRAYDRKYFEHENEKFGFEISWLEGRLNPRSARMAEGFEVICSFVEDDVSHETIQILASLGVKLIALRSAGFNHVDVQAAKEAGIKVVRVPGYSPHAVAEFTVALLLNLNRKVHRSYLRVREGNFSLDGLVGFELKSKKIGVLGTGRIGKAVCEILIGFGCEILAHDLSPSEELKNKGVRYVDLDELLSAADVITLHVPLTPETEHLIDEDRFTLMKDGVFLVNTSRGRLIETRALVRNLKSGKIRGAALDVYEEEEGVFFHDLSEQILQDDLLSRLITFPNVLVTSHQGFLTEEALSEIARVTLGNIEGFIQGSVDSGNLV